MTAGITVVVIDDTRSGREATAGEFEALGCTVLTAPCPASAVSLLREAHVSLVRVNPNMSGAFELITTMSSVVQEHNVVVMPFSPFEPTGSDGG